jgi:hypothetical protein
MHTGIAPRAVVAATRRPASARGAHPVAALNTFFARRLLAPHPMRRALAALGVAYAITILLLAIGGDTLDGAMARHPRLDLLLLGNAVHRACDRRRMPPRGGGGVPRWPRTWRQKACSASRTACWTCRTFLALRRPCRARHALIKAEAELRMAVWETVADGGLPRQFSAESACGE